MRRHRRTTAKHRLPAPEDTTRVVKRTIEMVDHTGTAHFLTVDAAADGLAVILPGALVARMARWCPLCPVPTQRSRGTR